MKINSTTNSYERLASMQKINSASDNPAGIAISEKMSNQAKGLEQGVENNENMQNAVKTAEVGLKSVHNKLQRMRELAVQSANGTLAQSDKKALQSEVKELKENINQTGENTEFNNQKLLNGNFKNKKVASNPNGSGSEVSINELSTSSLGIDSVDVSSNPDIKKIDKAIGKVSDMRNELGSKQNGLEYSADKNRINRYNTIQANSRIKDANFAEEIVKQKKEQFLKQYQYFAQNQQSKTQENMLDIIS